MHHASRSSSPGRLRPAPAARWLLRHLGFPAVLASAVLLMVGLGALGVPSAKAATAVLLFEAVVLLGLQRVQPCVQAWRAWRSDAPVDALHLVFSNSLPLEVIRSILVGMLIASGSALSGWWGGTLWPTGAPFVLQVALALLIGDFVVYWYHRLSHAWPPLWKLHALHHSSERLYLLSSVRTHPLHLVGTFVLQTVPLVVAGAGPDVLAYMGVIHGVVGMIQHANIDLWHGPFNLVFATADYHRWHHSADMAEGNTNFGNTLIVWDTLFGTRYLPKAPRTPEAVGLIGSRPFPRDFFGQLGSPLTWRD